MALPNPQLARLRRAINAAFTTYDQLRLMVGEGEWSGLVNLQLEQIVSPGPMEIVAFNLVRWSERRARTIELAKNCIAANPDNPELQQAWNEFAQLPSQIPVLREGEDVSIGEFTGYELAQIRKRIARRVLIVSVVVTLVTVLIGIVIILNLSVTDPVRILNGSEFLDNIARQAKVLSPDQFTGFREQTERADNSHFDFGELAVIGVRDAPNPAGNWVFTVVPLDCRYVNSSRGEFRLEVRPELLPDDFHFTAYLPSDGTYRVIEGTARIKRVIWFVNDTKGTILLESTSFRKAEATITCPDT